MDGVKISWFYCVGHTQSVADEPECVEGDEGQLVECRFQGYLEERCNRGRLGNGLCKCGMRCPNCGASLVKVALSNYGSKGIRTDKLVNTMDESDASQTSSNLSTTGDRQNRSRRAEEHSHIQIDERPLKKPKIVRWKNGIIGVTIGTYTPVVTSRKRRRGDE